LIGPLRSRASCVAKTSGSVAQCRTTVDTRSHARPSPSTWSVIRVNFGWAWGHVPSPNDFIWEGALPITGRLVTFSVCHKSVQNKIGCHHIGQFKLKTPSKPIFGRGSVADSTWVGSLQRASDRLPHKILHKYVAYISVT